MFTLKLCCKILCSCVCISCCCLLNTLIYADGWFKPTEDYYTYFSILSKLTTESTSRVGLDAHSSRIYYYSWTMPSINLWPRLWQACGACEDAYCIVNYALHLYQHQWRKSFAMLSFAIPLPCCISPLPVVQHGKGKITMLSLCYLFWR